MRTLQALLQHVNHSLVRGLGLYVGLRVSRCGEGELYAPVFAKLLEIVACELWTVVGDNLFWNPKEGDHIGPQKLSDLKVCYSAECFFLQPISRSSRLLPGGRSFSWRCRKFPHYIHAPRFEGPW